MQGAKGRASQRLQPTVSKRAECSRAPCPLPWLVWEERGGGGWARGGMRNGQGNKGQERTLGPSASSHHQASEQDRMYVCAGDRVELESSRVSVAGNVDEQAYTRTSTRMHRGKTNSFRRAHTKIKPYLFFPLPFFR